MTKLFILVCINLSISLVIIFFLLFLLSLGIPTLAYGLACWMLVSCHEDVETSRGVVRIYFLNKEDKDAMY